IWEGTPALLLRPQRQFRLVYEVNGLPSVELKYHFPQIGRELVTRLRAQERALLRTADRVLTQSNTTRKYLRSHGASGDRLRVIPNGVDFGFRISDFGLSDPADSEIRNPKSEIPLLLYLG